MNANRDHANRPTKLTPADHARQRAAIARHDAAIARANRNATIAKWCTRVLIVALVAVAILTY